MNILKLYLDEALRLGILDEVHFWNNTRTVEDENYLKSISNLKRTSSTGKGTYIPITPEISNQSFELNVKASNDIHIQLRHMESVYEIVLGGWNNTRSVIRENEVERVALENDSLDGSHFQPIQIRIHRGMLQVMKNNILCMYTKIKPGFELRDISFKTGHQSVADLTYSTTNNPGYYFMDTCIKNWKNYYQFYDQPQYEKDVILKCDDDIIFIDLYKLPSFIAFVRDTEYDLVFANTINNGVSAYLQQNRYHLIPEEVMILEYPTDGYEGSLWESGIKAETLHRYFVSHYLSFLDHDYKKEVVPITTQFSINFFGYKGKNWSKLKDAYIADEYSLTVEYVKHREFKNVFYSDFYVSHLSYFMQINTGIPLQPLLNLYYQLYVRIKDSGRFIRKI